MVGSLNERILSDANDRWQWVKVDSKALYGQRNASFRDERGRKCRAAEIDCARAATSALKSLKGRVQSTCAALVLLDREAFVPDPDLYPCDPLAQNHCHYNHA